jgi:hypothetical protein
MSIDRRLREGVGRITSEVDPDVDRHLDQARRHARRKIAFRRAGAVLAAAGVIAGVVLLGPHAIDALGNLTRQQPASNPTPRQHSTILIGNQAIAGTYGRTVPADEAIIRTDHLAGRWSMTLRPDGTMAMIAPRPFTGVLSGILYHIQGNRFRTNLFVQDLCSNVAVTYQWTRSGSELSLTPLDDPCEARVALLASGPWTRVR